MSENTSIDGTFPEGELTLPELIAERDELLDTVDQIPYDKDYAEDLFAIVLRVLLYHKSSLFG